VGKLRTLKTLGFPNGGDKNERISKQSHREMIMDVKMNQRGVRITVMGVCMGMGLVMGGVLGLIMDNMAFSAGGGMILGLALGTALESRRARG
jgi:hypothetical protein